jgi:hypothetical protein
MKYILIVVVAFGAYYYYQESKLYTHENIINSVLSKQNEMCSHQDMLNHQKITTAECHSMFSSNTETCVSAMRSQYSGSKFSSKDEANSAGAKLANCLTGRKQI